MMDRLFFLRPNCEMGPIALSAVLDVLRRPEPIDICVAYFNHQTISREILQRADRGLLTRILINKADIIRPINPLSSEVVVSPAIRDIFRKVSTNRSLQSVLQLRTIGRSKGAGQNSAMHHKFLVTNNYVGFGSMNFTYNALSNNFENFSFTAEWTVVGQFKSEFQNLWDEAEDLITSGDGVRAIDCPACNEPGSVDFESYGASCITCGHTFKV